MDAGELVAFHQAHREWLEARNASMQASGGWPSLIGLHWITLDGHYIGSGPRNGMRLPMGPSELGLVNRRQGGIYFTPARGVAMTLDERRTRGRVRLHSDRSDSPNAIGFDEGKGRLTLIERGGRFGLRVSHDDAPERLAFSGIETWPADPGWLIEARFVPHASERTLDIVNIIGHTEAMPSPGVVEFERDGQTHTLQALEAGDGLWLILADGTSGHDSYGAGRYLDVAAPDDEGRVRLDFNRLHNPPCAFTDFATCPLPPLENRLRLRITAGEMRYKRPSATATGLVGT